VWLILCHAYDASSHWLSQALRNRGVLGVEMLSAEELPYALSWKHLLSSQSVSVEFELNGGRTYRSSQIDGVVNRIDHVDPRVWHRSTDGDREYVLQELSAFYSSWLFGLPCPVYNPPDPLCLSGRSRTLAEWTVLAGKAGLAAAVFHTSSRDGEVRKVGESTRDQQGAGLLSLLAFHEKVFGPPVGSAIREGCAKLTFLSGCPILGIDFHVATSGELTFACARTMPDFRIGGALLVAEIAKRMGRG
jgi:hypothetical protein